MTPSIAEAQQFGRSQLSGSISPDVDVQLLLCHVLQCQSVQLLTSPEIVLSTQQWTRFAQLIERRSHGEPVAHLTGSRGFWSLELQVNSSTLIPRPDTELLVALLLPLLQPGMRVIDLGTGSGAIALSLAAERPDIEVIATDFSFDAIQLAQHNAKENALSNVLCVNASWLIGFQPAQFDVIVSNPPYIANHDPHLEQGDVRFEPLSALVAGEDGLDDIRQIVKQARFCLKPDGWLLVEHGYKQSAAVMQLFYEAGLTDISTHQDFGGNDRAVLGKLTV